MELVRAWRPAVPHVREVLHATFEEHAYPAHTHGDWTLLLVDAGAVSYALDGRAHHAAPAAVTLLPPHVAHDGRSAREHRAFHKRVVYLDETWLPPSSIGRSVDRPTVVHGSAVDAVRRLQDALTADDAFAAEAELVGVRDRLREHLDGQVPGTRPDLPLARLLRDLLDDRLADPPSLEEAATLLGASTGHLVRSFRSAYGLPPHRYLTGRRIDRARRLLLAGVPAAEVATVVGFHDQPHLARHFRRVLGTTPGRFARGA